MGAIGVGVGVGLARKDVLAPPFKKDITRWFKSRNGSTLIDSVAGRNATVLFPVSTFNGVDSKITNISLKLPDSSVEFSFIIDKDSGSLDYLPIIGGSVLLYVRDNTIGFYKLDSENAYTMCTTKIDYGKLCKCKIDFNTSEVVWNINGVITRNAVTTYRPTAATVFLGTDVDWYFKGLMWDVKMNDLQIPLPHLGYGIKADGTAVTLTNTNVGVDYHKDGSAWMLDYGCVKREPELYALADIVIDKDNGMPFKAISLLDYKNTKIRFSYNGHVTDASSDIRYAYDFYKEDGTYLRSGVLTNSSLTDKYVKIELKLPSDISRVHIFGYLAPRYIALGQGFLSNISLKVIENFIPNKPDGTPLLPLITGDTLIAGSPNFLNDSDFMVDMTGGVTDTTTLAEPEYAFFDKTNTAIWK